MSLDCILNNQYDIQVSSSEPTTGDFWIDTSEQGGDGFYTKEEVDNKFSTKTYVDEQIQAIPKPEMGEASASEETKKLYGLGADATNDDLFRVIRNFKWRKVKEFKTAGSYSWTPDHEGVYGFFVVGAGGSGCAGGDDNNICTGGASGRTKTFVKKIRYGEMVQIVVGKGGAPQVIQISNQYEGENGGSTSCLGVVAIGGQGGKRGNSFGASGAQCTAIGRNSPDGTRGYFGGEIELQYYGNLNYWITSNAPTECWNFFEGIPVLGSGANIGCYSSYSGPETSAKGGKNLDGYGGGDARFSTSRSIVAESGTLPGCGGGAAVVKGANSSKTATSGAGADGAVFIYEGMF